jgi:N utilization substance protein A
MHVDFVQALKDIQREKDIPLDTLSEIVEAALVSAYRKHFGSEAQLKVEIDWEASRIEVYTRKQIVESVEDSNTQLSLEEARSLMPGDAPESLKLGDYLEILVPPEDFGRIAAQTAKQVMVQRIREAERDVIFSEFSEREGEVVTGVVQRREGATVFINLGKIEAILPRSEQMSSDSYRFGERLKLYVVEVKKTTKTPHVLVSRSHPGLLRRLFELEVPEVHDGVVEIKSIAREAGARSKVAVASRQDNVDPVGACVGHRGSRVQAVVDELRNEKIDIVRWSDDMQRYLASALSPAKVSEVRLSDDDRRATVIVPESQLSLAIGKEGQNVRLAARLTGWRIDICSEEQLRAQAHAARAEELAAKMAAAETLAAAEAEAAEAEPAPVEVEAETAEQAAPVAEPEPMAEEAAPVAEPEPTAEEAAPVAEPEPTAEEAAPVAEPEPMAEEAAPVAEPEPAAEEGAAVGEPEPTAEEAPLVAEAEPTAEAEQRQEEQPA